MLTQLSYFILNGTRTHFYCMWYMWPERAFQWFSHLNDLMWMEELTTSLYHREERFYKSWFYWQEFCTTLECSSHLLQDIGQNGAISVSFIKAWIC